jgi:hypothetical protein
MQEKFVENVIVIELLNEFIRYINSKNLRFFFTKECYVTLS